MASLSVRDITEQLPFVNWVSRCPSLLARATYTCVDEEAVLMIDHDMVIVSKPPQ